MNKFNCSYCQHDLFIVKYINNRKQLLLLNKMYALIHYESGLKPPSNNFNDVEIRILNIF